MPPPVPASVNDGRMIAGRPTKLERVLGLVQGVGDAGAGALQPDRVHGVAELLPVLGLVDDLGPRADHLDPVLGQHALALEGQRRRSAPSGRPWSATARPASPCAMILATISGGDRLDVGRVGHVRVGHDRGRVRVDQDDPVALGAQRLAGLDAGVVELAGLADDDRAGADDQDGRNVGSFGHSVSRAGEPSRETPRGGRSWIEG